MFTHLHTHTEYSLLDGMSRITPLVDRVKALGMDSLAMTDHGALYGAIDFYQACVAKGVKPIIGLEAYVAPGSRHGREKNDAGPYHLVLLARNLQGYKNLIALTTKANLEGYYYKPRVDRELLEMHSAGLTVLSGCPSGEFHRRIQEGDREGAIEVINWHREVFDNHYFLEVQDHGDEKFTRLNPLIYDIGRQLQIPLVATNDSHFTMEDEAEAHDTLLCIGTNATVDQQNRYKFDGKGYHVKSEAEMARIFPDNPEFLSNTRLVADDCDIGLKFGRQLLPEPPVPPGMASDEYLAKVCFEGLHRRFPEVTSELHDRLTYELEVLRQTGFSDYMFVVKEIGDYAHRAGIRMGVRGSAAASLVLYALGVTDIDPVANRLVFERFLNLERREMPDVDFDFADDRRDEMIRFAFQRYGHDRVAQIITFGTLGAKAAIRDVGRAQGLSYAETDRVARLIPDRLHVSLSDAVEESGELKAAMAADTRISKLVEIARKLEGVSRHSSTHAAGVVISRDPLIEHVPLQRPARGDETSIPTTQFAMEQVASIGLLKMDFLGLSNLTILGRAIDLIRETTGEEVDLLTVPDGDLKTMEMLGKGETFGVFQLESAGMRRYVQELKPSNIADLCAMVALYRPGPMDHIPRYIDGKHKRVVVSYPHPDLAGILDETYGVIVYQDQVLLIAQRFAGYTLGQADVMRKAMGKKKAEIMDAEEAQFIRGAMEKGYSESDSRAVFDLIKPFAGYAFNKAHSWCYGNIAYQTAYLKANYSVQYMCAVLQLTKSAPDTQDRIASAAAECAKLGIALLPPSVNHSEENFSVESAVPGQLAIRFGLGVIKNVGPAAAEGIIAVRKESGPYRDIEDFCKRADLSNANSRSLEHLAKAGAMDEIGDRGTLFLNAERIMNLARKERDLKESGQATMFDLFGSEVDTPMPALDLAKAPAKKEDMLAWERELLGVYVSEHPFRSIAAAVGPYASHQMADLTMEVAGQTVTVAGMVNRVQSRATRDGRRFLIVELEDLSGSAEITIWNDILELTGEEMWAEGQVVVASVECRERAERLNSSVRKASLFDRAEGTVAGFSPAQWQSPERKKAPPSPPAQPDPTPVAISAGAEPLELPPQPAAPVAITVTAGAGSPVSVSVTPAPYARTDSSTPRPSSHGGPQRGANAAPHRNGNGNGYGNGRESSGGHQPPAPVEQNTRLVITIYETEDEAADRLILKTVVNALGEHPGNDLVRLVIHTATGEDEEFDMPTASVTEALAHTLTVFLRANKGSVKVLGSKAVGV